MAKRMVMLVSLLRTAAVDSVDGSGRTRGFDGWLAINPRRRYYSEPSESNYHATAAVVGQRHAWDEGEEREEEEEEEGEE